MNSMKKRFALVIAASLCAVAHAGGNSNNSGDTTNNYDQRNYGGNTTNAGGNGGAGGTGLGVGIGFAGASGDAAWLREKINKSKEPDSRDCAEQRSGK